MDFIIDTVGTTSETTNYEIINDIGPSPAIGKLLDQYKDALEVSSSKLPVECKKKNKSKIEEFCEEMGWSSKKTKKETNKPHTVNIAEVLKKSITTPSVQMSKKRLKAEKKREQEKSKGNKWFGLPATEMTDEIKTDLEILKMRSVLDPKHFYKKNDLPVLPKYFQIGKVLDSPLEYYTNRLTRHERKRTLVDELLADAEFVKYNKRKYKEIIEEKQKTHYKAYRNAKKLKRRNKK